MSRRIAIVEDEPVIRANYADVLKSRATKSPRTQAATKRSAHFAPGCRPRPIDIGLADDIDGGFALCRGSRIVGEPADHLLRRAIPTSTSSRAYASARTT
jgi:two-component system OmpR family response regulator